MSEKTTSETGKVIRVAAGGRSVMVQVWGDGPRLLVCLHGFGGSGENFKRMFPEAPAGYRVAAVDLPHFGGSFWEGEIPGNMPGELAANLANELQATDLNLLGFSIGARWALCMAGSSPVPVKRCVLISPDGLRRHFVYGLATGTAPGRWLFGLLMRWPGPLFAAAWLLKAIGILPGANYRFMRGQMATPEARALLRDVWLSYAVLRPDWRELSVGTSAMGTTWDLIWGKSDRITPVKSGDRFLRMFPKARKHVVAGGHFLSFERLGGMVRGMLS